MTPLFVRWLGGRREKRERTLPLSDLLRQRMTDEFSRRRGERQIEAVVDDVAERLKPLIRTRFAALPENEVISCLEAVADTFNRADLSDDALFAADLDPARLSARLRESAPPAGLSELGERLYAVALDDCARCFTQFVVQTAPFNNRATVEILSRLSELTDLMSDAVQRLAVAVPESGGDFLARYQQFLIKKLDALELVGLDTQFRPQTTLSVAYISLAVSEDGSRTRSARYPRWDPSMLRHAWPDGAGSERVEQALARQSRTLIRGEAGAGKSTLLRWLAVTAARHGFTGALTDWNGRVPFLIKLRSWPGTLPRPEEFLNGVADPIVGAMPPSWVDTQLRAGRGLLLVDGVDELPAERRSRVRSWLRDLLVEYPDVLVVVTSRPPAAPTRWLDAESFTTLTLERLAPADVRALIDQWHRAARTSPSLPCPPNDLPRFEQALLTHLAANRHVHRLAGNPLLAAMLCALNLDRKSQLPPDRMGIYQAAVEMLLHRRDAERGVHSTLPDMTVSERLELLQDLAWRLSLNGRSELPRDEAIGYLSRRLAGMPRVTAQAENVLQNLVERSGILREPTADRVDFVHRTFQEYLAAREAADQNMGGLLVRHAHLDTWREIIIMAAGHANLPMRAELIGGILGRAEREPSRRRGLVLLAAACWETMPRLEPSELRTRIDVLLDTLLPPRSRSEARSLAAVGEPMLDRLPRDLATLTEAQAAAVVRTVALINGPRALPMLAGYAPDDRSTVTDALVESWPYFDPYEYAERVLSRSALSGFVSIDRPAILGAAGRLKQDIEISASFTETIDLESIPTCPALTYLTLLHGWRGPLASLRRFPSLRDIALYSHGPALSPNDLDVLAELPNLTALGFLSQKTDSSTLDRIAALATLETLALDLSDQIRSAEPLSRLPRLRALTLWDGSITSFRPLAQLPIRYLTLGDIRLPRRGAESLVAGFPGIETLQLAGTRRWLKGLEFLAGFEHLEDLALWGDQADLLTSMAAPASLRRIRLLSTNGVDLSRLAELTQLQEIEFGAPTPIDLSCFARWKGGTLRLRVRRETTMSGTSELPPSVRIHRRR